MYYPDLTPYKFGGDELQPDILNIGWLSAAEPFRSGIVDEQFVEALRRLVAARVNLYRGKHYCEFCPGPTFITAPSGLRLAEPSPGTSGNGEIRVVAANGITYVAPVLVLHYVVTHKYLPPPEFIEAVITTAPT
jgi:hypothetical protein